MSTGRRASASRHASSSSASSPTRPTRWLLVSRARMTEVSPEAEPGRLAAPGVRRNIGCASAALDALLDLCRPGGREGSIEFGVHFSFLSFDFTAYQGELRRAVAHRENAADVRPQGLTRRPPGPYFGVSGCLYAVRRRGSVHDRRLPEPLRRRRNGRRGSREPPCLPRASSRASSAARWSSAERTDTNAWLRMEFMPLPLRCGRGCDP